MAALEFARWVDERIESLPHDDYILRKRPSKRLVEELYPLSRLALAFKQPGQGVEVEAFENSGQADGHIWTTGFRERNFPVQITFAGFGYEDYLRSVLLCEQGCVPGFGPIKRNNDGTITAVTACDDHDGRIEHLASDICARFSSKAAHGYPANTALVIAFYDLSFGCRDHWKRLYNAIDLQGGLDHTKFLRVYLLNGGSNEIQWFS